MKNAKQRQLEYTAQRLGVLTKAHVKEVLESQDFPDFDPARAERLYRQAIAAGTLGVESNPANFQRIQY